MFAEDARCQRTGGTISQAACSEIQHHRQQVAGDESAICMQLYVCPLAPRLVPNLTHGGAAPAAPRVFTLRKVDHMSSNSMLSYFSAFKASGFKLLLLLSTTNFAQCIVSRRLFWPWSVRSPSVFLLPLFGLLLLACPLAAVR